MKKQKTGLALLSGILLLISACHSKEQSAAAETKTISISEIPKEIKIPVKIWEVLAKDEKAKGEKASESAESSLSTDAYVFSEVKVSLKEKNPDVIKEGEVMIELPRGGGEIDLARYVTDRQGSFYVKFDFPEFTDAKSKKVLFVSHSRKRKIDDQIYGSGCHDFFDITDRFLKEMSQEGLKVNTTRNRHVSVLAGTFILMAKKDGQSYITQVTSRTAKTKSAVPGQLTESFDGEPMEQTLIRDLKDKDTVDLLFLVKEKNVSFGKNGRPFMSLQLGDQSGSIDARLWDRVEEVSREFETGDIIRVKGQIQIFQNRKQLILHKLEKVDAAAANFEDFLPRTLRNSEDMMAELTQLVKSMHNDYLRQLITDTLEDPEIRPLVMRAPAAKSIHHAWIGGLLEHILSICKIMDFMGKHYSFLNRDLFTFPVRSFMTSEKSGNCHMTTEFPTRIGVVCWGICRWLVS